MYKLKNNGVILWTKRKPMFQAVEIIQGNIFFS